MPMYDWTYMETEIKANRGRLGLFSKIYNVPNKDMKAALITHFGDAIEFRVGRNGGIFFKTRSHFVTTTVSNNVSTFSTVQSSQPINII